LRYLPALRQAVRLCRKERFAPAEAFRLGLFQSASRRPPAGRFISRKSLTKLQEALNPPSWAPLLRDKGLFYRHCLDTGVATAALYALMLPGATGWSPNSALLAGRRHWRRFLAAELPDEFVVKPARGAYGRGVNIYHRSGERFADAFGRTCDADGLYEALAAAARRDDGMVIQQRLHNHPALVRLTGTESLQTVRVVTLAQAEGPCRILHAHFKPIVGPHIIDTYLDGLLGNVEAAVQIEDGRLMAANRITDTGSGIQPVPVHPKTQAPFEGFLLPSWSQTCRLVRQAADRFLPLRCIGWDVALTPEGPRILEGNVWWDPPNQHETVPAVVAALAGACADFRFFCET
jgi:hypothetical protein